MIFGKNSYLSDIRDEASKTDTLYLGQRDSKPNNRFEEPEVSRKSGRPVTDKKGFFSGKEDVQMKKRDKQRKNRKLKEAMLSIKNEYGNYDPTAFEAVKNIVLENCKKKTGGI